MIGDRQGKRAQLGLAVQGLTHVVRGGNRLADVDHAVGDHGVHAQRDLVGGHDLLTGSNG
jgi:hypothetical protein